MAPLVTDEAIYRRVTSANARRAGHPLGYALAWLFARRDVVSHIGWRFTFGTFRGREFLLEIEEP